MTVWTALRRTYGESWRFLVALPLIAAAVVGVEGLQHVVEWRAGFYAGAAGMKAAANNPGRMAAGSLKVGWLLVIGFWTARYFASRSPRKTLAFDPVAVRKYGWVLLFSAALGVITLFGPDLGPVLGVSRRTAGLASLAFSVLSYPVGVMLTPWAVGAALGDRRATWAFAFRRARGSVIWGLGLSILAPLPLMVAHYALGYGALAQSPAVAMAILAIDALLVGYLGVVIAMCQAVLAERMAEHAGEALTLAPN